MGIYDRDYYRESPLGSMRSFTGTVVFKLIIINFVIWVLQIITVHQKSNWIIENFACKPSDVFQNFHIWQIFTANFLHDPKSPMHIFGNMLFLFFFGPELEKIYGKRDFLIFYLFAGMIAMFAQAGLGKLLPGDAVIIGASGSVMGIVVLFTTFYPNRKIYLLAIVPVPIWILCVFYILYDLQGTLAGGQGVAHLAHLAGGATGLLYRLYDFRLESLRRKFLGRSSRRTHGPRKPKSIGSWFSASKNQQEGKVIQFPQSKYQQVTTTRERDPISTRIDQLLEKISRDGKESLSEKELEYLKENSQHYKSR